MKAKFSIKKIYLPLVFLYLMGMEISAQCPISGYTYIGSYEGHHYYLSNFTEQSSVAHSIAGGLSGYLASITTSGENNWLYPKLPTYVLIGLNDVAVEGQFSWPSGETYGAFTSWYPGEPNNSGNEDYVVTNFRAIDGRWNDIPDFLNGGPWKVRFVVEIPDSDGDGASNYCDACPTDPLKTSPGVCGCGVSDVDTDGDGTEDCHDGCPEDPLKINAGICGCGVSDVDTDGDGTADCQDGCPNDPNKIALGQCGCGNEDTDSDCDGIADCNDLCPGGDDSVDNNADHIPDCSQLLSYEDYSSAWKCAPDKIQVCHDGDEGPETLCISKNALPAHYNHGDNIGPCFNCGNALKSSGPATDENDSHNHGKADVSSEILKIVPNPASSYAEIWLEGLNTPGMITVMDLNGKTIWQTRFAARQNVVRLDFVGSMSSGGTYFVRLDSSERRFTKRLMVVK